MSGNKPPDPPDPPDIPSPVTPPFTPLPSDQPSTPSNPLEQFANVICNTAMQENSTRKRHGIDEVSAPPHKRLNQTRSVVGRDKYTINDNGPYIVHVSRIESQLGSGISLHPVSFGLFLFNNKINNVVKDGVKRVGRNRVSIQFSSPQDANSFLCNPLLNTYKYSANIPTCNITRMGVVSGIPTDMVDEDVIKFVSVPQGCGQIIKVRRLNRKTFTEGVLEWKPTETCVLTFDGQVLPKRVFLCYNSLPVQQYIYPTVQCRKCCRYGHVESICRSKPRCSKCGHDHPGNGCSVTEREAFCILCSGGHFADSKVCPEFGRQRAIKTMMAEKNMSYMEASKLIPSPTRRYADSLKSPLLTQSPHPTQTTQPIQTTQPTQSLQHTQSYRKTVARQPKPRTQPSQSYDKVSHHSLTYSPHSSQPNGCALNNQSLEPSIIDILIQLLTSLLTSNPTLSPSIIPSNAANSLLQLLTNLKNGVPTNISSMECEECVS